MMFVLGVSTHQSRPRSLSASFVTAAVTVSTGHRVDSGAQGPSRFNQLGKEGTLELPWRRIKKGRVKCGLLYHES